MTTRTCARLLVGVGVAAGLATAPVGIAEPGPTATPMPPSGPAAELIVKFKPGVTAVERDRVLADADGVFERKLRRHPARIARVGRDVISRALMQLRSDPRVAYAEPNYRVHKAALPNDPSFAELWGLRNTGQTVSGTSGTPDADIDADEAWDVTTGSSSVVVGVIDSGVDFSHPDLGGSGTASPLMWTNAGEMGSGKEQNRVDDDGNGYVDDWRGWDFANDDNNPFDDHGHGTHVTGTIGARANNGVGVTGVSWNVKIMALKFLNASGSGFIVDAVEAIEYAASMGADVTNNSWGANAYSHALLEAIQDADEKGSLFVVSAGNDASNNDDVPDYPSTYDVPNIVSVAASTQTDERASFSNFGRRTVDLAAPGTNVYSTIPRGGYDWWDGTSMATPHVVGAAALVKAVFPSASAVGTKALLLGAVDPADAFADRVGSGGRLNVGRAVNCSLTPLLWVEAPSAGFEVAVDESLQIAAISTMCASGAGATATAEVNGRSVVLTNRGDGLYTGSYVPSVPGSVSVTVTGSGGGRTRTRTVSGTAVKNYRFVEDTYAWIDATTGLGATPLPLGDDASRTVTLPFSFSLYEQLSTSVRVSSNGFLVFGSSEATDPFNDSIPDVAQPNAVVAPFWDDLDPSVSGAAVWHRTVGTAPNRKFAVSWIRVRHFAGITDGRITFQAVLEEATGDAVFQYLDTSFADAAIDHGASATVGVERADGLLGREFSFERPLIEPYQGTKALRVTMRDTTPPETDIDSGPSGTTNDDKPTFAFSSNEPGATFECSVDAAAFAACSGAGSHTTQLLAEGPHTFEVRATDEVGYVDPSPASRSFTVDTTPPETTIDSGPSETTNEDTPTFGFSSNEPSATFQCSVDGAAFAACSGPGSHTTQLLANGPHTFEARATDQGGNVDPSPASRSFTVDTSPPSPQPPAPQPPAPQPPAPQPPAAPQPQPRPKAKPRPKKVTLCYRGRTIKVAKSKVRKLRKRGAKLGACKRKPKKSRR